SLPSILIFAALASSTASRAPFSLSLPRCAMPPVSGATLPIEIVSLAGACAFLSSLQPPTQAKATIAITPKWERIMAASGSRRSAKKSGDYAEGPRGCQFPRRFMLRDEAAARCLRQAGNALFLADFAYLIVRMYFARVL